MSKEKGKDSQERSKYDETLKINTSLEDVLKVSIPKKDKKEKCLDGI
ncbi:hypothetical protein [Zobellia galactanivorans]|uniref:Uncharacterized protein n=1 Tax=Zobellia galactanivorans (strain DSM 12802 / CCUG 47099 / CIP 106680 / NCIMB 13871 / Dsij) TaxID=63186 RepID=G0L484_ZOBGA|nr:hypothetical protein [Zobellia galactanivorans]CAZ98721.1 Putative protein [Zobellia galactanivorans]